LLGARGQPAGQQRSSSGESRRADGQLAEAERLQTGAGGRESKSNFGPGNLWATSGGAERERDWLALECARSPLREWRQHLGAAAVREQKGERSKRRVERSKQKAESALYGATFSPNQKAAD